VIETSPAVQVEESFLPSLCLDCGGLRLFIAGTETPARKEKQEKNKFMSQPNINGFATVSRSNPGVVPFTFNPARSSPTFPRPFRAASTLPAWSCRLPPNRVPTSRRSLAFGPLVKKVLLPCAAAFLFGKTLSYIVEFSDFIMVMLR
jgi:hypothetical protein